MQDETFFAVTDDGWRLALHRFVPDGPARRHPLLLVHGLAANRLTFDLNEHYSLARAARQRGFDVYILELRGAGVTQAPEGADRSQYEWSFYDYAERDLPTAIATVLERSRAPALHGLGHSMGGMLFYSAGVRARAELRSITAIGAPIMSQLQLGARERSLLQVAASLTPAATLTPTAQRRVPLRRLLGAALRYMPMSARLADGILLNSANCEPAVVARMAREGIEDLPLRLLRDIIQHMGRPPIPGGPFAFEAQLAGIEVPVLVIAGAADRLAPPAAVAAAAAQLRGAAVRYHAMGLAQGLSAEYGHVDLLLGRRAPEEIYPRILDFLQEVD